MNLEETLKSETKEEIIEKLKIDENYYGSYGQQFLSNSDVKGLTGKPGDFRKPGTPSAALLVGGAFHTMMLEPHKMVNYPIFDSSSRKTKKYLAAEEEAGKMLLIKKDGELLEALRKSLEDLPFRYPSKNGSKSIQELIEEGDAEIPEYGQIFGEYWKGKADVVNHGAKLIIDLKTSSNMDGFSSAASKWNYDSQAFIYRELFEYDMVFIVFDKRTHRIGYFECSEEFYLTGREKVIDAVYSYRANHKQNQKEEQDFDYKRYLQYSTL